MENLHHYATRFPSRALYCYPRSTCSNTIVCIFHGSRTVPNSCSCASCSRDVGVFGWLGGTWKSLDRLQCFLVGHPNEKLFHWTRFMGRLPASLRVPHNCPFQPKTQSWNICWPPSSSPDFLSSSPVHALHHIQLEPMPAWPLQDSYVLTLTKRKFSTQNEGHFLCTMCNLFNNSIFYYYPTETAQTR